MLQYWQHFDVDKRFSFYIALNASVQTVLTSIAEPTAMNAAEDKVIKFLRDIHHKYESIRAQMISRICDW